MPLAQNPFYIGEGGLLDFSQFSGRVELRELFCNCIGVSELGDKLHRQHGINHKLLLIEGARGYGKSAFGSWCSFFPKYVNNSESYLISAAIKASQSQRNYPPYLQMLKDIDHAVWLSSQLHRKSIKKIFSWIKRKQHDGINLILSVFCGADMRNKIFHTDAKSTIKSISLESKDILPQGKLIIVIDDIGEHQAETGVSEFENNLVGFVNEFLETEHRKDLEITIILLAYPGFISKLPPERSFRRRAGVSVYKLDEFLYADTEALIRKAFSQVGFVDETILNLWTGFIHSASGGIPDIVQSIGYCAFNNIDSLNAVTTTDLNEIVKNPMPVLIQKLVSQLEYRKVHCKRFSKEDLQFSNELSIEPVSQIRPLSKTISEWEIYLEEHSLSQIITIKNFLNKLVETNVLIQDREHPENYHFFADAIRVALPILLKYFMRT